MTAPATFSPAVLAQAGLTHAMEPHPDMEVPDVAALLRAGVDSGKIAEYLAARHRAIAAMRADPLREGWQSPGLRRVREVLERMRSEVADGVLYVLMLGGNRAGKSDACARLIMECLTSAPGKAAWCFQATQKVSQETQQAVIWRYFPPECKPQGDAKSLKRTQSTKVVYTQGSGFSADSFVLNGSRCEFKFYAGDITTLQGPEVDMVWFDELVPLAWVEDARYRLVTRNGIMLISFTPIEGFSDTVAAFLGGVEIGKDGIPRGEAMIDAELLPLRGADGEVIGYEQVPLVLRTNDPARAVIWFPTQENFYGGYPVLKKELSRASREEILVRAYGIPLRKYGSVFQFGKKNLVDAAGRAQLLEKRKDFTFYMVMDPAGTGVARNPFMQWWAVNAAGQKTCVREWPQPGDYMPGVGAESGTWALSGGKADGTRGPGQVWFGFGLEGIVAEVRRVEAEMGITVWERYMDSRAGNSTTMTTGGAKTLIEMFSDLADGLEFAPASGRGTTETGETWKLALQAKLEVHPAIGAPEIMVCDCCANTVFALTNWTGLDKEAGACKDPVDTAKYLMLADPLFIPPVSATSPGGGRRYF